AEKSVKKMVTEVRKGVYNECCGGRLGCLFRSPCSGNSSVLIYLERGEALGLLCYSSRGVGGQPARGFPSESAVFRPMCVAEKRYWRSQVRGTTQIRGGVGRT